MPIGSTGKGGGSGLPSQWTVDSHGNLLIAPDAPGSLGGFNGIGGIVIRCPDDNTTNDMLVLQAQNGASKVLADEFGSLIGNFLNMGNEIASEPGKIGFFGHATAAQPTGVAVTAAAIHAALVSLGLITA